MRSSRSSADVRLAGALVLAVLVLMVLGAVALVSVRSEDDAAGPRLSEQLPAKSRTDVPVPPAVGAGVIDGPPGVESLPHAIGFGRGTTGGAGGQRYVVTSDQDSATDPVPGTLRYGLEMRGKVWITFADDMTIRFADAMRLTSDKTVDGRGRDVVLTGPGVSGLQIYDVDNVILVGLTLDHFGRLGETDENNPSDAVDIQRSSHVWIDHCSLSRAADKAVSVEDGARFITLSWNWFHDQEQVMQLGSMFTAEQDLEMTVTVHHNLFDNVGYRTPEVSYGKAHVLNNYILRWQTVAVRSVRLAQIYLEGNVFEPGPSKHAALTRPAQECNDKGTLCDGRAGFLHATGNSVINGRADVQSSGSTGVFSPAASYAYAAAPADAALVTSIVAGAGAGSGATP